MIFRNGFAFALLLICPYVVNAQSGSQESFDELQQRAQQLLLDQKYEELDDLISGIRSSGGQDVDSSANLTWLYGNLGKSTGGRQNNTSAIKDRLQRVTAWSQARPSVAAQIVLAACYCDQAENARGSGLAGTVTFDGRNEEDQSTRNAEAALRKATSLAADQGVRDPNIASTYMDIGMHAGYTREQMQGYVDESLEIDPWFTTTIHSMSYYLMPRWYGEPGDRAEFAQACAAAHKEQSGDSAYAIVALQSFGTGDVTDFSPDGFPWPRVRQGFRDLLGRTPDSSLRLGQLARMAHIAGDRETARDAIERLEGRWPKNVWTTEPLYHCSVRWAFDDGQPGESLRVIELGPQAQSNVCVVNEGSDFALSNTGYYLPVYRIETGERVKQISTWPKRIYMVANQSFGKTTDFVMKSDSEYSVERVDLEREAFELIGTTDTAVGDIVTSADRRGIALCDFDSDVKFWRIEKDPLPYEWSKVFPEWLAGVALSPDANRLLSGSARTLKTWDTQSREVLHTWDAQNERSYAVAWSPDGHTLASAGTGTDIMLWSADDGRELGHITTGVPNQHIISLAFSPDSKRVVAGTYSPSDSPPPGQVLICDVASAKLVKTLAGHRLGVTGVTVTPDGELILSSSDDGSVRIWEMPSE